MYEVDGVAYLDTLTAAKRLGLSARTLINQRSEGRSPMRYIKHLGRVLYPLAEVEAHARTACR